MTSTEKITTGIIITIFASIVLYLIGVGQGWWNNIFAKPKSEGPVKTDYEKCLEANKAKADGETCTSCVDTSSGNSGALFEGEIRNGECQPKGKPSNIVTTKRWIIGNTNGALIYNFTNGQFSSPVTPVKIPYGTEIKITAFSTDKKYANTDQGWISSGDIEEKKI